MVTSKVTKKRHVANTETRPYKLVAYLSKEEKDRLIVKNQRQAGQQQ